VLQSVCLLGSIMNPQESEAFTLPAFNLCVLLNAFNLYHCDAVSCSASVSQTFADGQPALLKFGKLENRGDFEISVKHASLTGKVRGVCTKTHQ
jgi:hypothetical protein